MKKIRVYFKPDMETDDWPIYFYPHEYDDTGRTMWVMDKDNSFKYEFDIPFFDGNDWVIQKENVDGTWEDIL